ncbi:uncharacterized protein TrAtP1_001696 [Trichoderma atroviride]|uniref:SET domain-containing protein n=1 Tax=Hypocrea atroviridis (strain ATCC 20476 / IMI 206040) TaxID=452589 RepID=G9P0C8_HYPAI|nr:uncharacterized protein TRIATDRAFT_86045 [Trichoderma atroviride IMI 206040]EHK43119.1 hypothetical protein TRIATDRAFT_86045 [Trichoderma atroviride IMI 206040]UKZ60416.1 hypothetical protein TrAtP1_001696 [Trichoderma atroviride]
MPLNHPYKKLPVPGDAPFELKPSPGKGWGAFAKRRISKGATILAEKPLLIIQKPVQEITDHDVAMAFLQLAPRDKEKFLRLGDNGPGPFESCLAAMAQNTFEFLIRGSNLPVYGLFVLLSRFNHSCAPNSKVPLLVTERGQETLAIIAKKDISVGEEITFSYLPGFELKAQHERHRLLQFTCKCDACHAGIEQKQASDLRRTLVRGLQYLSRGNDPDDQAQDSTLPFSIDPELKKAAEELRIPLSSRFVYDLLSMVLLEEEGLMDDLIVKKVQTVSDWFETESNDMIVKLAMAQTTWREKFNVAARLYGREDAADDDVANELRTMRDLNLGQ